MELEREFQRPNKRFCQLKVRKIKWKIKTAERKKIPSSCRFKSYFCNLLFHFGKKQFLITLRVSGVFFFFHFPSSKVHMERKLINICLITAHSPFLWTRRKTFSEPWFSLQRIFSFVPLILQQPPA